MFVVWNPEVTVAVVCNLGVVVFNPVVVVMTPVVPVCSSELAAWKPVVVGCVLMVSDITCDWCMVQWWLTYSQLGLKPGTGQKGYPRFS